MRTLTFCLVGTSPLLLHHISKHQLRENIASQCGANKTFRDEAREVMLINGDGNPVVSADWLLDAIRVACGRIVIDSKQLSFFRISSMIRFIEGTFALRDTDNRDPEWIVYASSQHAQPGSKKMIAVIAPQFNDWMIDVAIAVYGDFPDDTLLQTIFNEAGRVGIGLFHPPKKHFGQFKISL